jgi:Fic family protein
MELLNTATVRITPEVLSLIAEIDEFKGAWRAIGRIAPKRLSSLRRVATIESVGSSTRIEGARLTDREVENFLANIRLGSFTPHDEQEVAGYAEVMETIFSAYEAISFTENHIRQLHRDLLAHSRKDDRHRGAYKTISNNVEAFNEQGQSLGIVFETATPFDTPRRMEELIAWLDEQGREKRLHPLLVVAIFVVVFLEIHPFQDGNGRLSRILTTLLLLRAGYAYVPYTSLESTMEQSKESYYSSLRRTQGTTRNAEPDWNPWIEYFLRALHRQKTRLEKKMERERIILADMPELSVTLLELAREQGRITVAEAARITAASRYTIKDHLRALVHQGHLVLRGAGRGAWYGLS